MSLIFLSMAELVGSGVCEEESEHETVLQKQKRNGFTEKKVNGNLCYKCLPLLVDLRVEIWDHLYVIFQSIFNSWE